MLERPSDPIDGALKGTCSVLAGVGSGFGYIVMAPVVGVYENGIVGLATGAMVGTVGAVLCVSAGACAGAMQVLRGIIVTPEAIDGLLTGKEWDYKAERWIFYSLEEEHLLVMNMGFNDYVRFAAPFMAHKLHLSDDNNQGGSGTSRRSPQRDVKETRLYDVLGVPTDAGQDDIKKAYRKQALKYHPDKSAEKDAKERFQEISEAYKVLSDEDARTKYDRAGQDAIKGGPKMDAKGFYMLMFGSEEFEPLVGKMFITTMLGMEMDDFIGPPGMDPDVAKQMNMQLAKWKREVQCAYNLKELIQRYVSGDEDEAQFRERIREFGEKLSTCLIGRAVLGVVGYCYQHEASQALSYSKVSGSISERAYARSCQLYNMGHVIKTYSSAASSAVEVLQEAAKQDGKVSFGAEHAAQTSRLLWNLTVIEIEDLITQVVFKVTHDADVTKEVRAKRAHGIYIAGDVLCSFDTAPQHKCLAELRERITVGM